ncbi:MAG: 6-phosphofructokinase [Deltaproteobacteria bacterium]|nr:6-phosphofructokinase [Deltaproteobacteria bacterium]
MGDGVKGKKTAHVASTAPRLGILTGGGDCPGLNAVIRAVVWRATAAGRTVVGIRNGWRGLLDGETQPLDREIVRGILYRGGTILGTSRTNPFKTAEGGAKAVQQVAALGLAAIVAVGGEDTLGVALRLHETGVPIVGVPKTIDNDLPGTDLTFGFDTAVQIATDAIDRLTTTAESHDRVLVVEVMGRYAGWIAVHSGLAGGADVILVPEYPFSVGEVAAIIKRRRAVGRNYSIVVVAEGARLRDKEQEAVVLASQRRDEFGHAQLGGIGAVLAQAIEQTTGFETRVTVLGHIQRGGSPTAFDRVLATRFGVAAADCVLRKDYGVMVALRGNAVATVPLTLLADGTKTIGEEWHALTKVFQF